MRLRALGWGAAGTVVLAAVVGCSNALGYDDLTFETAQTSTGGSGTGASVGQGGSGTGAASGSAGYGGLPEGIGGTAAGTGVGGTASPGGSAGAGGDTGGVGGTAGSGMGGTNAGGTSGAGVGGANGAGGSGVGGSNGAGTGGSGVGGSNGTGSGGASGSTSSGGAGGTNGSGTGGGSGSGTGGSGTGTGGSGTGGSGTGGSGTGGSGTGGKGGTNGSGGSSGTNGSGGSGGSTVGHYETLTDPSATGNETNGIPVCCVPSQTEKDRINQGFALLNQHRAANGRSALAYDVKLEATIEGHCHHMVVHSFFSHTAPESSISSPWTRANKCGTSANGENIYYGSSNPQSAMTAWINSPGHNQNMLGNYSRVGIGNYNTHWGQIFGS